MKRKIVSCVLVSSLLFSIGCYNTVVLTKEELKTKTTQDDITVWTKDSLNYEFSKKLYRIQGDTLSGLTGIRVVWISSNMFVRDSVVTSIALADITSIETSEPSVVKTVLLIVGLLVVVGGIGFVNSFSSR